MRVKATSTIGKAGQGATWTTEMDANESQVSQLATFGLIYLQQRNSAIDGILGITRKEKNDKGKEITVRTGVKRGDVVIDAKMREELAKELGVVTLPDNGGKWEVQTDVTEYAGEVSGPAYKRSVKEIAKLVGMGILTEKQGDAAIAKICEEAGVSVEEATT